MYKIVGAFAGFCWVLFSALLIDIVGLMGVIFTILAAALVIFLACWLYAYIVVRFKNKSGSQ